VDDLTRFVETLQGKGVVGEIAVPNSLVRCKAQGLSRDFSDAIRKAEILLSQIDSRWLITRIPGKS
jgi:hypothetical protein